MDSSTGRQAPVFRTISRAATLSEKVVATVTGRIIDGRLAPGEPLASERELAEQFGVSRTVIREALRSLVASGLVEARSGRGLQVAEPKPDIASRALAVFLHRDPTIDYPRVHEVRTTLEIDIAGYAADRRTPADVDRLKALNAELEATPDIERAAELDVAFHRAVAEVTQNELFPILLDALGPVLLEVRKRGFAAPEVREDALMAHQQILDAIADGDPERARAAMRQHLNFGAEAWVGVEGSSGSEA